METKVGFGILHQEGDSDVIVEMVAHKVYRRKIDETLERSRIIKGLKEYFGALLEKTSYECHTAPYEVSVRQANMDHGEIHTIVYPDFTIINPKRFGRMNRVPDLVVEIVSIETLCYNLTVKLGAYERAAVKEYWVIHPKDETLQIYELDESGRYRSKINPFYRYDEILSRVIPLARLELVKIFGVRLKPLPKIYPEMSGYYCYADYLKWMPEYRGELVEGRIYKMLDDQGMLHKETVDRLMKQIGSCMMEKETMLLPSTYHVRFPASHAKRRNRDIYTVVRPDVVVITDKKKIGLAGYIGTPGLIVEVLAAFNKEKDEKLKKRVYEDLGVKEYWVVDPCEKSVTVHVLDSKYKYQTKSNRLKVQKVSSAVFPEILVDFEKVFETEGL
jgi:Uma2 family endonuclease